jgi:predicted MFS family arabinose efflux permease
VTRRFSRTELTLLTLLFSARVVAVTGIQMGSALFPALSRLLDVPVSTVTLLTSAWAFTGLATPLFGPASDRYGHGLFLLIGLATFILGNLLSALAPNFATLLVFQALVGLGYAVFSFNTSAFVGDLFAYESRARAIGVVRFGVSVAALAGVPAAAAITDRATARWAFGTVGGLGLVVLAVALPLLSKHSRETEKTQLLDAGPNPEQWTVLRIARQKSAMIGLLVVTSWAAIASGIFIYLAAWLEQAFQLSETQVGLAFSTMGVGSLVGTGMAAAWADQLGKKRSAISGLLVLSTTAVLLPRSPGLTAVLVALVVFTAGLDFGFTALTTLMTELAPAARGTLMSLVSLSIGAGTGLAPLVMRPLWESGGYALVTLVLGTAGLCVALFAALFVTEPQPLPGEGTPGAGHVTP